MRRWTPEQDLEVMLVAQNNPDHLRMAFTEVSKRIGRTPESVVTRYYSFLIKKKGMSVELMRFAIKHDLSYVEVKNDQPGNDMQCGVGKITYNVCIAATNL